MAFGSLGVRVKVILGLDPGRDKVGWAFVGSTRNLLQSGIFQAGERALFWAALRALNREPDALNAWTLERLSSASASLPLSALVVGDGTGGGELALDAEKQAFGCPVFRVDEEGTTLEARNLYWLLHAPSWWQRFLPRSLWIPPRPLDDLAAWAIARRGMVEAS